MLTSEQAADKLKKLGKIGRAIFSKSKSEYKKAELKCIEGGEYYQLSKYTDTQVFHENLISGGAEAVIAAMELGFGQCAVFGEKDATLLRNKKGLYTLTGVKEGTFTSFTHDRKKNYIIEPKGGNEELWLVALGITSKEGKVKMYKKLGQINRFAELVRDIEEHVPNGSVVVDMGCGKSYLTFALYYYFNIIKNKNITFRGYDLKKEVVDDCNDLAKRCGYDKLTFFCEDIANVNNDDGKISMLITLHACNTATDIAIYHGIRWGCNVMMNVPCCQKELNQSLKSNFSPVVFEHGIIKERITALMTDAVRARLIELCGYNVEVLEFVDIENTPKNLLIRSVKNGRKSEDKRAECDKLLKELEAFGGEITLAELLQNI